MPKNYKCLDLFLPNHWNRHIKSALLHVISLARLACVPAWAWAAGSDRYILPAAMAFNLRTICFRVAPATAIKVCF